MKTASNGGLGFGSRIRLDDLKRDAEKLKSELRSASVSGTESMNTLSKSAASAIEGMARRVRSGIKETEADINSLSRKIIQQASLIKDIERDVEQRKTRYKTSFGIDKTAAFGEYQAAKRALDEEKAALAGLNAERGTARVKLTEMKQELRGYNEQLTQGNSLKRDMLGLLGKIGGVYALKRLGQEIIDVRGEMQMLSISFTTLLNSKEKADKLMGELTQSVLTTPLQLTELAQGAKQLLAFGFQAEQVNDTLLKLGNIAKGLNIPLSDMVYLYGTTMTEGRLFARDLRQFTTRGIPLADELAKQFGVAKERVSEMVTAGKVGFPEVEKALNGMTSEGGRFYNLMQEQVKSIPGQISNLKDSLTMQFNKIGESMEGAISGGISATKLLVDNLDVLGKMLVGMVATYGAYRTAIILADIAQSGYGIKTLVLRSYILLTQKAQALLNATMLANPYVAATVAIVALISVMWAFSDSTTASEKAQKSLNETLEKSKAKKEEMTSEVQKLVGAIRSETSSVYETIKAYDELIKRYSFFAKYSREDLKNMTESDIKALLSSFGQQTEKELAQSNYDAEVSKIKELERKIKYAAPSSPIATWKEDLAIATDKAAGLKKELENIARLEKEAKIASMSQEDRVKYYQGEIDRIKQVKEDISKTANGAMKDVLLAGLNAEISAIEAKLAKTKQEEVKRDKAYWEKQKKNAEEALDSIDREIFKRIESGDRKGIAQGILDIYDTNTAIKKKAESLLSEKKDSTSDPLKAQQELNDKQLQLLRNFEKAKLEAMQEGRDKELEEIRLATAQKIDEINKQERELEKAYKSNKQSMPESDRAMFASQRDIATTSGRTATNAVNTKYYNELIAREKELSQVFLSENEKKKQSIKDRYDAERKWANEMFGSGGMTQEQYNSFINLIDSAETEAHLADFRDKYKTVADQITDIEKQAALDRAKATTDAQKEMIDEWEKAQKSRIVSQNLMKDGSFATLLGNLDRLGTGKISSALATAKQKVNEAMKGGELTPTDFKTLIDAIEKGETEVRERNPFKALKEAVEEYKKQPKGEKDITAIAQSAAAGFNQVAGALGAVVGGLKKMGLAGDEETQQLLGEITNLATSASDLAMGIASKNPVQIIQGTIGVVTSLFEIFDKKSRDAQREIRKQEQAVKDLQKAYKALEQEVKKALSTDYYSKQVDQARNLEQQIQRVYAMIRAEESKSKRKRDAEKIEGWRNEIDDLRNQAADIRRAVVDELMTTDLRSFSSQLASSMLQGYAEGMEDLESVVQGSMDDLMRSMITKQFDMLVAQKLLKPLFDAMERSINVDAGDFTFDESDLQQIRAAGQSAKNSLLEAGEGFRDILKGLGLDTLGEQERQGAKKGIANASQESIDDLTGRVTNIQSHTYSISNDFKALLNSTNIIVKHMMNIDTNTKRLETIENDISEVRKGIDTINLKGVQLR